ncbi:MAG: competence/damage-inducible protein A [Chloroflexi bacterium]|nr:competence/damage-inducible protein A [Chloroflexota bacterium]
MKAEIISVGTELLLGHITDTNAPYLAQQLADLGIDLFWISQVGDNQSRLVDTLKRAWSRSDLIVMTGGVGPTEDDLSREAVAELLGEGMVVQPDLEVELRTFFVRRGVEMPASNVKQATLIPSAQVLSNPIGTAPGWWVENKGRIIVTMPGVPVEMRRMWEMEAVPKLRQKLRNGVILSRTLKILGLGESTVEEKVRHLLSSTSPTIATYAKDDGIHVRLTAKAKEEADAAALIAGMEEKVRAILDSYIYGVDDETLQGSIGKLLSDRGLTLATMEAATAGMLSALLTDAVESQRYFRGGLIAYSEGSRLNWGIPHSIVEAHGLVSAEAAAAMASAARKQLGADVGLAISAVVGPDQVEGKPAGTVLVAVDNRGDTKTGSTYYASTRPRIKYLATLAACNILRRSLLGLP